MPNRTNVLPFPAPETEPAPVVQSSEGVRVAPTVGNNAIELTYVDADQVPRIRMQLDTTVPPEIVQRAKRWMELTGGDLPPFPVSNRPPLLGPRRLP